MKSEIKSLIEKYAEVYGKFEALQDKNCKSLPGGDQKTGVIAEYYVKCYIEYSNHVVAEYASHGSPFDISYTSNSGQTIRAQVKAVSAHSKTRIIAPLRLFDDEGNRTFDDLYLVELGYDFSPVGLYINSFEAIQQRVNNPSRKRIQGSKMIDSTDQKKPGSSFFDFSENKVDELLRAIV
ncbi:MULTISPECIES: hypothetical protein [unclassified Imperialibacter]|uniref:hypothetical protein n=1 Tax=unclassified Imperialibacter TaxID=2629706 RepID=UPI0012528599|nr:MULTISPECIES: hypothetical protein [unclassified Imperialibacter]CAD5258198.1 conserved hypothetical protein [Imperialibacter sp. 89]CAD5273267.1 conserved hypothetical protein [Imperialibacter sp. 75]VVT32695.1 conserved hypothetical protein [Imperialibacter sp. EC-SDR9]